MIKRSVWRCVTGVLATLAACHSLAWTGSAQSGARIYIINADGSSNHGD